MLFISIRTLVRPLFSLYQHVTDGSNDSPEHYKHLHKFFAALPTLLSPTGRFSFFHGLGATSRLFYDVYTMVSTIHLQKLGFEIEWSEVPLLEGGGSGEVHWEGVDRQYWDHNLVGAYRLPIGRMK